MELLVVVAIIGVLVSILIPAMSKAKNQARTVVCASNLRSYGLIQHMYTDDNNDYYPWAWTSIYKAGGNPFGSFHYDNLLPDGPLAPYLENRDINICPTFALLARQMNFSEPKFTYSMNILIGVNNSGFSYGVGKKTQVERPYHTFFFAEENLWVTPGINGHVLNDNSLCTIWDCNHDLNTPPPFTDSFASFHLAPMDDLDAGLSNAVFVDGHVQRVTPEESYRLSRPTRKLKP